MDWARGDRYRLGVMTQPESDPAQMGPETASPGLPVDIAQEVPASGAEWSVERPRLASTPSSGSRSNLGLVLVLLGLGTLLLIAVLASFEGATVYAKGVDELLGDRARMVGRSVRVEGTLVRGSLEPVSSACEYRFELARNGSVLGVDYQGCVLPDSARDPGTAEVVLTAEGELLGSGRFRARKVVGKCPSKYEPRSGPPAAPRGAQPVPFRAAESPAPTRP